MLEHAPTSVLFIDNGMGPDLSLLVDYLQKIPHLHLSLRKRLPTDLSQWKVVVAPLGRDRTDEVANLTAFVEDGGGWLYPLDSQIEKIPVLFGAGPQPPGPDCEFRVLFEQRNHPLAVRLQEAFYVTGQYRPLELMAADAEQILYADWHYRHHAVLVQRPIGKGRVACTTLVDFGRSELCQIFYRLIRLMGGCHLVQRPLGVGILGYAPSVGLYHGQGSVHTAGLELRAACDLNQERLQQASQDFPEIQIYDSSIELMADDNVDLVIIATPPNTHAGLSVQMMDAGKHVICEKPLALSSAETSSMLDAANRNGVHLSCHQNRRWDPDYLAVKQAVEEHQIGDIFHLETFVGGYSHPCGYWHSEASVSGGTSYDWGGHYIDWIVSLFSDPITSVSGTRHKRVWHDVTNADQESVRIRFHGGSEAFFMHSDIAAARKPKWYLLGTRGALIGRWRDITDYAVDPVHYFQRHDIPATEMPPALTLYQRQPSGEISTLKPALPRREVFGFHRNIADHLLLGEPLKAPLQDSVLVVAVLEAAVKSMANGGAEEVLNV